MASRVLGVGCESDDQRGFAGWRTQKTIRMVIDTFKYYGIGRIYVISTRSWL